MFFYKIDELVPFCGTVYFFGIDFLYCNLLLCIAFCGDISNKAYTFFFVQVSPTCQPTDQWLEVGSVSGKPLLPPGHLAGLVGGLTLGIYFILSCLSFTIAHSMLSEPSASLNKKLDQGFLTDVIHEIGAIYSHKYIKNSSWFESPCQSQFTSVY